jgi:hypothetical protein
MSLSFSAFVHSFRTRRALALVSSVAAPELDELAVAEAVGVGAVALGATYAEPCGADGAPLPEGPELVSLQPPAPNERTTASAHLRA